MRFCAVVRENMRETGRSAPLPFERAYALVRRLNRANQDQTRDAERRYVAYVEEAASVRHLPVNVEGR